MSSQSLPSSVHAPCLLLPRCSAIVAAHFATASPPADSSECCPTPLPFASSLTWHHKSHVSAARTSTVLLRPKFTEQGLAARSGSLLQPTPTLLAPAHSAGLCPAAAGAGAALWLPPPASARDAMTSRDAKQPPKAKPAYISVRGPAGRRGSPPAASAHRPPRPRSLSSSPILFLPAHHVPYSSFGLSCRCGPDCMCS